MQLLLREGQQSDLPFMQEMLYEAVFWRENPNKPSFVEALALPEVSKSLAGWGERDRDTAVIALINSVPVAAAWFRFWNDDIHDRGYFEEQTPVLVIGVHADYRHQGIGGEMIGWLKESASNDNLEKISLMVSKDNYAFNLYKQQGFKVYEDVRDAFIMVCKICSDQS